MPSAQRHLLSRNTQNCFVLKKEKEKEITLFDIANSLLSFRVISNRIEALSTQLQLPVHKLKTKRNNKIVFANFVAQHKTRKKKIVEKKRNKLQHRS